MNSTELQKKAVECLRDFGNLTVKEDLKWLTFQTALSFIEIGKAAIKTELKLVALRTAEFLAELTSLSAEPTSKAIGACELEYRKDESFLKFKKLYEEELERLQASQETS